MIGKKLVDRYAHQSGVKDQLVAEREIALTYALGLLRETNALDHLAFKGGTCLRKMVFGSTGRFSEDLDFTLRADDDQAALTALYEAFHHEYHGDRRVDRICIEGVDLGVPALDRLASSRCLP